MSSSILVVGPAWVGDMVMAQALFIRLREVYPSCMIDVLAPSWSLPVLARMPQVRCGIELPLMHGEFGFRVRRRLGRALRENCYERAIVLPNSWKSALVPFFAGIPRRTGYARELRYGLLNDLRRLDTTRLRTTAERFVALAVDRPGSERPSIPTPKLLSDSRRGGELRRSLKLPSGPSVALMPGAEYGPAKRWPAGSFAELARQLGENGFRSWVFGSTQEQQLGEFISRESGGFANNLCGRTNLIDVIDLTALCEVAVTNDSGLMHLAAAVGVPVVAIYGSSTPSHTPPMSVRKRIHYLQLDCSPCFKRVCPLGHTNCLKGIAPGTVFESVKKFISI